MLRAIFAGITALMLLLVVGNSNLTLANEKGQKQIATLKNVDSQISSGMAKTFVKTGKKLVQKFQVIATDLEPNTEYSLAVDSNIIDIKQSDKQGAIEFSYSSQPSKSQLDEIQPLPKQIISVKTIKNISIYKENKLVLSGNFTRSIDDEIMPNFVVPDVTVQAGQTVRVNVNVTDPQGQPLTLSIKCDRGNFITIMGLTLVISPQASDVGQSVCTVTATNTTGLFSNASFIIFVTATNRAPMIATVPDQRVKVGDTLRVTVRASDPDNDTLRFSVPTAPLSLINVGSDVSGGAILTFSPRSLDQGGRVTVRAIDSGGLTSETSFNLTVDRAVIISSVVREKNLLFVTGQGFGSSGARIMINGQDLSSRLIGQTDSTLTIKGARRKANLKAGQNTLIITANGTSATFIFSLRDFN
ncbi:MAG: hypothetical protein HY819_04275 [Acidobacteria bacterium]|nr:hypothetical protein [Acidobacteriota bacterium]